MKARPAGGVAACTLPSLGWLLVFFLVPTLIVFAIAFKPSDPFGRHRRRLDRRRRSPGSSTPSYAAHRLAHGVAEPADHGAVPAAGDARGLRHRAGRAARARHALLLLVIVPFWTSFLIRIFAWKVLLHPEGALKGALVALGLVSEQAPLLYNAGRGAAGHGLHLPAVRHPADLRRRREVRLPAARGRARPRRLAAARLLARVPPRHPPRAADRHPGRLHPGARART